MSCDICQFKGMRDKYPFEAVDTLGSASHFGVSTGHCSRCGQAALLYWVEIFDEMSEFACAISDVELSALRAAASEIEIKGITTNILSSRPIVRGSERGFYWVDGKVATLDGPAW